MNPLYDRIITHVKKSMPDYVYDRKLFTLISDHKGIRISYWNTDIMPEPTEEELENIVVVEEEIEDLGIIESLRNIKDLQPVAKKGFINDEFKDVYNTSDKTYCIPDLVRTVQYLLEEIDALKLSVNK